MRFGYDRALLERCPELVAGVVWVRGLVNRAEVDAIDDLLTAAEGVTRERFPATPDIAKSPTIAAWRQVYSRLGVKPNRYPCAAESLIRRVVEAGQVPRLSGLVDLCNAASLRAGIPVAPFDLSRFQGDCIVRFARGDEYFSPINAREPEPVPAGEVVYADGAPDVLSRRWNWRQSDRGKITLAATDVVITTEAVHAAAREAVAGVIEMLAGGIQEFLAGEVETAVLDPSQPHSTCPFA